MKGYKKKGIKVFSMNVAEIVDDKPVKISGPQVGVFVGAVIILVAIIIIGLMSAYYLGIF
ncbi:hypothetical protein ACFL2R_00905 [Patescibacteria group bacterium]